MPKKLKIHPNERIDLGDFEWGTAGYPDAVQEEQNKLLVIGRRAQTLAGFRIALDDQNTASGRITVYDGSYLNVDGKLVTNSETTSHSETVVLLGANLTFYVELEFVESEVDIDNRAIWDSTYDNGVGKPKGREFYDDVTTRTSTIWRVVSPISTTGFAATFDATSPKVPLAIFKTDSTGKITVGSNPGLITGPFSSVLEESSSSGTTFFRVLDASYLPNHGQSVTIGSQTKVISNIDHAAGTFTTTTPATSSVPAGTIVKGDPALNFMRQRTSVQIELTGAQSTHPDKLRRMFSANEARGNAVISSKYVSLARDDTSIETLRDYVDVLAAQLRELKVGSTAPIYSGPFSTARYYDYFGSLQTVRTATYTIGNGTTTFGDFNGTTEGPFTEAVGAAIARGLTTVTIVVRPGIYVWGGTVGGAISINLIGDNSPGNTDVTFTGGTITTPMFGITGALGVRNIHVIGSTSASCTFYAPTVNANLEITRCSFNLLSSSLIASSVNATIAIRNSTVSAAHSNTIYGPSVVSTVDGSTITLGSGATNINFVTTSYDPGSTAKLIWRDSSFFTSALYGAFVVGPVAIDSHIQGCDFSLFANPTRAAIMAVGATVNVVYSGNRINCPFADGSTYILHLQYTSGCRILWNTFVVSSVPTAVDCSVIFSENNFVTDLVVTGNSFTFPVGSPSCGIRLSLSSVGRAVVSGNRFTGGLHAMAVEGAASDSESFVFEDNTCLQQSDSAVEISAIVFGSPAPTFKSVTISDNQCRQLRGGGLSISATDGTVVVASNVLEQDAGATAIPGSAIYIEGARRAVVTGNTAQGTTTAVVGSALERSSLRTKNVRECVASGNIFLWNPVGGGTALQANIRAEGTERLMCTGNEIYGRNDTTENCRAATLTDGTRGAFMSNLFICINSASDLMPMYSVQTGAVLSPASITFASNATASSLLEYP